MLCYNRQKWGAIDWDLIKNKQHKYGYGESHICDVCAKAKKKKEFDIYWTRVCVVCGAEFNRYHIRKTLQSGNSNLRPFVCTKTKCHKRILNAFSFPRYRNITKTKLFGMMAHAHVNKDYDKAETAFAIGELIYYSRQKGNANGKNRPRVKRLTV